MPETHNYDLYHAPRTRSVRVRWLLGEMGLPCTLHAVQFASRPPGDENYGDVHPLRKVPAFQDGETSIFESLAICQYILAKNPGSSLEVTPDEPDFGRYLQWLHFGEAGMMMPVSMLLAHTSLLPEDKRDPAILAWARMETGKILNFLSEHAVADRQFIAADRFTAADISITYMFYLLKIIREFGNAPDNLQTYFNNMTARESWKIATG